MSDLNKVMLIGNVTKDPELKTTTSGKGVCSFSLATNKKWNDNGVKKEKAEFHNCVAWGKLATDVIGVYVKKGMKVYVEGRLETRAWEDQNGVKKFRTEIIVEQLSMLSSGANNGGYAQKKQNNVQDDEMPVIQADEEEISIEDIPF
jgi:single-strand DNA-binding protein